MDRRQVWRRFKQVWITTALTATVIFTVWSLVAYRASAEARAALISDGVAGVAHEDAIWRFTPARYASVDPVALVFFPGSLVDPVAYAPIARAAAEAGFIAYIVELPRRGAFGGGADPALRARLLSLLAQPRTPKRWVAAGHSLGGVVTSQVAADTVRGLSGVVLIGTSHPRDVDLSALTIPVTKIVGTNDGLASREEVEANKAKLPPSTRWVWVQGGNHSQFGWYGFQPFDRRATIDAGEQRRIMIDGVLATLRAVAAQHAPLPAAP